MDQIECDAVIFGGGIAGLWLLDELTRRGKSALLLESHALGAGQTIAAQGILHSGLKYALQGLLTPSAREAREMPALWRECLEGRAAPDLRNVRIRSPWCYLWRTGSWSSKMGMLGARIGLRVTPETVDSSERPASLQHCPGPVARVAEPVLCLASLLQEFADRHAERIVRMDTLEQTQFEAHKSGMVRSIRLHGKAGQPSIRVKFQTVVLTAGAGNAALRERCGLSSQAMQRRPLHMVMLRGDLPECFGHCVDGAATRVTITSDRDATGRRVWQVGGQLAEAGVGLDPLTLIARARDELTAALPGVDLSRAEWGTYRIDRAEGATSNGERPESVRIIEEGNVITAWPTKLVLAPQLARQVAERLGSDPGRLSAERFPQLADWPRPGIALPPWERSAEWYELDPASSRRKAA